MDEDEWYKMAGVKEHLKWDGIGGSEEHTTPEVTTAGSKNGETNFLHLICCLIFATLCITLIIMFRITYQEECIGIQRSIYVKILGMFCLRMKLIDIFGCSKWLQPAGNRFHRLSGGTKTRKLIY